MTDALPAPDRPTVPLPDPAAHAGFPVQDPEAAARQRRAFPILLLAIFCFSTSWPVAKLGLGEAAPLWFAAARTALTAAVAFAILVATGRLRVPGRGDLPILLSIGLFQYGLFSLLSNFGLHEISASRSIVLAYTTTLWLVPMALLVGERVGPWAILGTLIGLGGIAVLFNPLALDWSDRHILTGNLILVLAALCWAVGIFHARRHGWRLTPLQMLPWQTGLAAVLMACVAAVLEPGGSIGSTPIALLCLFYVGGVTGPLGNWAGTTVARDLPLLTSSLGFLAAPVFGMALSIVMLGEDLPAVLILGAALILIGIGCVTIGTVRGR